MKKERKTISKLLLLSTICFCFNEVDNFGHCTWSWLAYSVSIFKIPKSICRSKLSLSSIVKLLSFTGGKMWRDTRFRCATLDHTDQTIWITHQWRGATQNTRSEKRLIRTMLWTMVALPSDQRAKLQYSLIIGRTKIWTMVAPRSDQRAKSQYSLIISRTKIWTKVALRSDQMAKSHYSLIIGRMLSEKSHSPVKTNFLKFSSMTCFFTLLVVHSGLETGSVELHKLTIGELIGAQGKI